jgi:predicted nucleotidyltransferase
MKNQKLKVKDTQILFSDLKRVLKKCTDISAAYLFGSAARDEHAVNKGILLKNDEPEYLSDTIDNFSRHLLENELMMIRGKRLRQERLEVFSETG